MFLEEWRLKLFWEKVDILSEDECWCWKAGTDWYGYGLFGIGNKKVKRSHVISFLLHNKQEYDEVPFGYEIRHKCDNTSCVNPKHLLIGTHADNMIDMAERGRAGKNLGIKNHQSILNDDIVRIIREMFSSGMSNPVIGTQLNLDRTTVYNVTSGKYWGHVK